MGNIWEALYQGLSVSITALVLLLVKRIFRDKLSPRWQYGVWAVLALRCAIPAGFSRGLIPELGILCEAAKSALELDLGSAYSAPFESLHMGSSLPWISSAPQSVTDWLFVLYAAGAALTLAWFAWRYAKLRALLRRGRPADGAVREAIEAAAGRYSLKPCRAVIVPGLKSAFVCGVFRPVLAVPEGEAPDQKILLHELLHLRYCDAAQGVFWCLLRALHWCNPFMQYVFGRVGNDMEALCDQRVLERLEGEERRLYGGILLDMANSAYPCAPGTSSISNGARNIARRIEAIARFKLYPGGMALAGVCVSVVLGSLLLTGAYAGDISPWAHPSSPAQAAASLSAARVIRCSTMGGALDVYANGLAEGNGVYLAMVSDSGGQAAYYHEMTGRGAGGTLWQVAEPIDSAGSATAEFASFVSLREAGGGVYRCGLVLPTLDGGVLVPVELWQEDGAWLVREYAPRRSLESVSPVFSMDMEGLPAAFTAEGQTEYGAVRGDIYTLSVIDTEGSGGSGADPDARLKVQARRFRVTFDCAGIYELEPQPYKVSLACEWVEHYGGEPLSAFPELAQGGGGSAGSGGYGMTNMDWPIDERMNIYPVPTVDYTIAADYLPEDDPLARPEGLRARVYIDTEPVADLNLKTEDAP